MEKYVPLVVGGVLLLFVLFGLFWGLVRGLKKTTFRVAWIVVTAVILLFVTPVVTKAIMKVELPFLSIEADGQTINTLNGLAEYYIKQIPDYGELLASSPEALDAVVTLVTLLINAFVFVILFWVTKIALWPVWAILAGIFIKKKDREGNKKPRKRGWGMLVGVVTGLFVGATTLMPVLGVINMASNIEKSTTGKYTKTVTNENGEKEEIEATGGELSKLGLDSIVEYLNVYSNSTTAKVLKYTGVEAYQNFLFNSLSTGKSDGEKIVLKDETKTVLITVNSVNTLTKANFNNLTQTKVGELISSAKVLIDQVFSIKTIQVVGDNLFPIILGDIVDNPDSVIKLPSTGEQLFDDGIIEGITELKDFKFSDLKNEILQILNIAETLNNKNIICKIANKEVTKAQDIIALFDTETVDGVTDSIFKMQTMSTFLPIAVNTGLEYVAKLIQTEGFKINEQNATLEEVKTMFKTIVNSVLAVSNSLDFDSKFYITENTLPNVGKVLDAIKNYGGLDEENYGILINQVETKLYNQASKSLENFNSDMEEMKDAVLDVIRNISDVTSFETEFTKINNAYTPLMSIVNGITSEPITIELDNVGKVVDTLKTTQMFGNAVNPIMEGALEYVKTIVPEGFEDFKVVIQCVKQNVPKVDSWETELNKLNGFVGLVQDVFKSEDLQNAILSEDSTLLTNLGKELNTLKTSILFGDQINDIVKILIDQVGKFTSDNDTMLTNSVNQIKSNIDSATTIDWEKEFGVIKTLINTLMDLSKSGLTDDAITGIGKTIDDVLESGSVLVNRAVINTMVDSAVDQFVGTVEQGSDLEEIVEIVKTQIKTDTTISFEQELKALNKLLTDISNIDMDNFSYSDFGTMLDSYDTESGTNKSIIVSKIRPNIVKMILNQVDTTDMDADIINILTTMKSNCANIVGYKNEFELLGDFVDTVTDVTNVYFDTFDFDSFGTKMDSYKNSALICPVRKNVLQYIISKVELTNTKQDIQTAIDNILAYTVQCGDKAEAGQLTYSQIFNDLGKLSKLTDAFTTVTVSRDNTQAITTLGKNLDELNALCVVPTTESVRIAKYITDELVGEKGIKSIIDQKYLENEQVKTVYEQAVTNVKTLNTKYANYLDTPDETSFNFEQDFEIITNSIKEVQDKLDQIENTEN